MISEALDFRTPHAVIMRQLGVPSSTFYEYLQRIEAHRKLSTELRREEAKAMAIRRVQSIVRMAVGARKYNDAVNGERLLADIEGTRHPTELSGPGGGPIPIENRTESDIVEAFKRMAGESPAAGAPAAATEASPADPAAGEGST
jgi:hypothetical protein